MAMRLCNLMTRAGMAVPGYAGRGMKAVAYGTASMVGCGLKAAVNTMARKAFEPFATIAAWIAAPVIYTWEPVHVFVNSVATPLAGKAVERAGWRMPAPIQMLFVYLGYELAKDSFEKKPLDLKRATVFSAVALYAYQDETVRKIAASAMTPTVLATLGFCAALDYANAVATEGRWIPSALANMANSTVGKIKTVRSMTWSGIQAATAA